LEKIRDALFQFFHENHKKFYQSNKEYIDNAHLNLPELRVKMESAQDLIEADDDDTQHGNFASWNLIVSITPRGDLFRGINGSGFITFGEFQGVIQQAYESRSLYYRSKSMAFLDESINFDHEDIIIDESEMVNAFDKED
jgi:hypothetical protein